MSFIEARADPVVRSLTLRTDDGPLRPVRILLMSDIHVEPSDMSPARIARIVRMSNQLHPDLVIIAGDFLGNDGFGPRYPEAQALAPLGRLRARFGIYAILGNNDRARRAILARDLRALGVRLIRDDALRAGPISLGGYERRFRHTTTELLNLPRPRILIGHSPQKFPDLPAGIAVMMAGHTHCGQISLPLFGPVVTGGDIPRAYACGFARLPGKVLVVTAGLGTSRVPMRFFAPPDMWLVSIVRGG